MNEEHNKLNNDEQIKQNIAANIAHYRKLANMTQGELAEQLGYSDKSVSKWERAEGVPDIYNLYAIASLFRITVTDLLSPQKKKHLPLEKMSKTLLTLIAIGLVWLIAVIVFVVLKLTIKWDSFYLIFIYAIPLSSIVGIVFGGVWHNRAMCGVFTSILIWSAALSLTLSVDIEEIWLVFLISAVLQVLAILWFFFRKLLNKLRGH